MGNEKAMSAERRILMDKLLAIVLLETSKPYKEMDSDLVTECVDFLMELEGKERLSKEEIKHRVDAIPFKGMATASVIHAQKKLRAKRLAVIAAVLAVLIALFSVLTLASEDPFGDLLFRMGNCFMEFLDSSGSVEYKGVTINKLDETRIYPTIEELLKAEEIEILYPTWLPNDEKVTLVTHQINDGAESYILACGNKHHSVKIRVNGTVSEEIKASNPFKEINGLTVYYFECGEFTQANFVYNNCLYKLGADTQEELFRIIENLKEIK